MLRTLEAGRTTTARSKKEQLTGLMNRLASQWNRVAPKTHGKAVYFVLRMKNIPFSFEMKKRNREAKQRVLRKGEEKLCCERWRQEEQRRQDQRKSSSPA